MIRNSPEEWSDYCLKKGSDGSMAWDIIADWREEKASRDSRILSAVPSEEEIESWYIEHYGVARDLDGKPSWCQGIGYRTDGDLFEMLNDFAKWIKQRGIAG